MDSNNKFLLPIAVIAAGIFIAGAVYWNGQHPGTTPTPQGQAATVDIKNVKTEGSPFIGDPNAPVTIAYWSDFQCPYCKSFDVGGVPQITNPPALPEIVKQYVDTGKAKVVFMDFAFLGPDSQTAAEYGRAIWKLYPAKYDEWHTAMYKAQDGENTGFGDAASIDKLDATIAGVDAAKVKADVQANSATYDAQIQADKDEGTKVGIDSTPSFVIGTQLIKGAYPFARFQQAIDPLLK